MGLCNVKIVNSTKLHYGIDSELTSIHTSKNIMVSEAYIKEKNGVELQYGRLTAGTLVRYRDTQVKSR
jgi:hypothetical protein